jgi:hypothetical protein
MSVLNELKKGASSDAPAEQMGRFEEPNAEAQNMQSMMEAQPIPGQSLTQDPENKGSWETPPEFTDIQDYVDETFLEFTDEEKMPKLLGAMRQIPIDDIAEMFLKKEVQKGRIDVNLMMLAIEPVMYMMNTVATYGGVEAILYPEDDLDDGEETRAETSELRNQMNQMKASEPEPTQMQAPAVIPKTPPSLLARKGG